MTGQEYEQIAAACDRLLRAPDTSLGRLAIPLLHVIDEHPAHLAQYSTLLESSSARPQTLAAHRSRFAMRAGRAARRSLHSSPIPWNELKALRHVDVLIVSRHGGAAVTDGNDFYFGPMQRMLRERGISIAVVFVNDLAHAISPMEEARIWRQCVAVRGQLRRAAQNAVHSLDGAVATLASRRALSGITAANLRVHANLSALCRLLQPRIVMTTYEGVATERLIWDAARRDGRQPLCVGYQHTRLLQRAHAIRRSIRAPGVDCNPQVVLTLGEESHAVLAASAELDGIELIRYGSHRRSAPAALVPSGERTRKCLVLPDGEEKECATLFEFALACARRCPDLAFTLRPHPLVDLDALRRRHAWLRDLPTNADFSLERSLAEECAEARYCLYRGSSAAIHATLAGVKPFYLARDGELPFDPLFGLPDWRETVTSAEEFAARAEAADVSPDVDAELRARGFCERQVSQVRPEALDELLASLQSRRPSSPSSSAISSAK